MDLLSSSSSKESTKLHKCTIIGCKAAFSRPWKLEAHERKHTGERPFVCDSPGCSKSYTNNSHLKRHKLVSHEDQQQKSEEIICEVENCRLVFSNKYSLKKHYSRIHTKDSKPLTCSQCSESFKKKRELREHMYSHNGTPQYQCDLCPRSFMEYHLYNKHKKYHKTYECDCGTVLQRWTELCAHKRTCKVSKKEHKCVVCNKIFSSGTNLKQHSLNVHVKESQTNFYQCPYLECKRRYTLKKNLTFHVTNVHEKCVEKCQEDNKFPCTEKNCKTVLKSKKNLKQHIRTVHKSLPAKERQRKPRKDIGTHKTSMLSVVIGIDLKNKQSTENVEEVIEIKETPDTKKNSEELKISKSISTPEVLVTSQSMKSTSMTSCHSGELLSDNDLLEECDETLNILNNCLIPGSVGA